MSRSEIKAAIWMNNGPIDSELCNREPSLKEMGLYRRLNDGKYEFISFCNEEIIHWLSIYDQDLENLLIKAGIEEKK